MVRSSSLFGLGCLHYLTTLFKNLTPRIIQNIGTMSKNEYLSKNAMSKNDYLVKERYE